MKRRSSDCERYGRRDFLHVGSASLLGLGLGQLLQARAAASETEPKPKKPTSVIMVWLSGGPATIDMWDMKPDAAAGVRGEFDPIDTSLDGVKICEHMPLLAKQMHHCSLIRSCHHTLAAHGPGTELLLTGNRPSPAIRYPSLGSIAAKTRAAAIGVPNAMSMGEGATANAGYLGAAFNPFKADVGFRRPGSAPSQTVGLPNGFTVDDLDRRSKLLKSFDQQLARLDDSPVADQLNQFQQQAIDILRSDKTRKALDLENEDKKLRDKYGFRQLGRRLLAARRLVESGVQFVTVGMTGWDTHGNNFGDLRNQLLPSLDQALATLIEDLDQRGMLDTTVVYCTGEFGRTPNINGGGGRDHWARSMAALMAGGPIKRGFVYGSTGPQGYEPADNPCTPMDLSATILKSMGLDSESMLTTPSGRPLAMIADGKPIHDLLA